MKKAFTMIEFIFVIVIIGILAAVAIPKMVATRDDARVSLELINLSTYIKDISNYYNATGIADINHSNVVLKCFEAEVTDENHTITISIVDGGPQDGERFCEKAQRDAAKKGLTGSHFVQIGGQRVKYE